MTEPYRGLTLAAAALAALGAAAPAAAEHTPAAGAEYADYLQSLGTLGYRTNALLAGATDCEVPALAGSSLECRIAPRHLWGEVDYGRLGREGQRELGGYDAERWSMIVGFDTSILPAAVIGASIGKVGNRLDYEGSDTRLKGDGWQAGLYASFDPGQFYVKALGAYTGMDGDSRRLDVAAIEGDPDVRLWSLGLHGGYRVTIGAASVVTPYLNYDRTNARLKSFKEAGGLSARGAAAKHGWVTAGVKLAGEVGGLVPEANLGYRHMFGDRRSSFDAAFADRQAVVASHRQGRGAVLAGLSVGGRLGTLDLRAGYDGAFRSGLAEHAGFLKLVVPLGGIDVPPPPPPLDVEVEPPAPPSADSQTCPGGSLVPASEACPPPPPAAGPERG